SDQLRRGREGRGGSALVLADRAPAGCRRTAEPTTVVPVQPSARRAAVRPERALLRGSAGGGSRCRARQPARCRVRFRWYRTRAAPRRGAQNGCAQAPDRDPAQAHGRAAAPALTRTPETARRAAEPWHAPGESLAHYSRTR